MAYIKSQTAAIVGRAHREGFYSIPHGNLGDIGIHDLINDPAITIGHRDVRDIKYKGMQKILDEEMHWTNPDFVNGGLEKYAFENNKEKTIKFIS